MNIPETSVEGMEMHRCQLNTHHVHKRGINDFDLILPGNCLGEEGCEALREVLESVDKADILASLR